MIDGKVVVRASFPQGWYGDKYDKDEIMPANEKQAQRLTQSGQAYYDFEPDTEPDPNEYVNMSNTKKEIEQFLDKYGYEYSEYMTKSELLDLIE